MAPVKRNPNYKRGAALLRRKKMALLRAKSKKDSGAHTVIYVHRDGKTKCCCHEVVKDGDVVYRHHGACLDDLERTAGGPDGFCKDFSDSPAACDAHPLCHTVHYPNRPYARPYCAAQKYMADATDVCCTHYCDFDDACCSGSDDEAVGNGVHVVVHGTGVRTKYHEDPEAACVHTHTIGDKTISIFEKSTTDSTGKPSASVAQAAADGLRKSIKIAEYAKFYIINHTTDQLFLESIPTANILGPLRIPANTEFIRVLLLHGVAQLMGTNYAGLGNIHIHEIVLSKDKKKYFLKTLEEVSSFENGRSYLIYTGNVTEINISLPPAGRPIAITLTEGKITPKTA